MHLLSLLVRAAATVRQAFDASGTTIRQNDGPTSSRHPHLHFHIVPRHDADGFCDAAVETMKLPELVRQAERFAANWTTQTTADRSSKPSNDHHTSTGLYRSRRAENRSRGATSHVDRITNRLMPSTDRPARSGGRARDAD